MTERLEPMVDMIGDFAVKHGERDDLDPEHPDACLCGVPHYLNCDSIFGGESIFGAEIVPLPEGGIEVRRDA